MNYWLGNNQKKFIDSLMLIVGLYVINTIQENEPFHAYLTRTSRSLAAIKNEALIQIESQSMTEVINKLTNSVISYEGKLQLYLACCLSNEELDENLSVANFKDYAIISGNQAREWRSELNKGDNKPQLSCGSLADSEEKARAHSPIASEIKKRSQLMIEPAKISETENGTAPGKKKRSRPTLTQRKFSGLYNKVKDKPELTAVLGES